MSEENVEPQETPAAEPDYESMSVEQLEGLMTGTEPAAEEVDTASEDVVEDEVEATPEPDPDTPPVEPEAETDPKPEAADEEAPPDQETLLREQVEVERKKMEADMALQRAHASRLAGEIGFLKQQLQARRAPEPQQPELREDVDYSGDDRLTLLQRKLESLETQKRQESVDQAIAGALQGFSSLMGEVSPEELKPAAEKFVGDWQQALDSTDPGTAGAMAKAVLTRIAADVEESRFLVKKQAAEERRAAMTQNLTKQKKAATISGAGAAAPPKPRQKTYDEMTVEELEVELNKLSG